MSLEPGLKQRDDGFLEEVPVVPGENGAHVVQNEGTDLPRRRGLNFEGPGVTATDDDANNATKVTIAPAALPSATAVGQVLISIDGSSFGLGLPITTKEGWLVNDEGHLLVGV